MDLPAVQVGMPLEEYLLLSDREGPFEIINGERIPKMPNVAGHGFVAQMIWDALNQYTGDKQLGSAFHEHAFVLSYTPGWVSGLRIPDVMYYTAERLEAYKATTPDWKQKTYILVPELVVEVISANDDLGELDEKIDLYLADGVQVVWVVDPGREKVSIYAPTPNRPNTKQQTNLKGGDILTGGEIIPGFEIAVVNLFE